MTGGTVTFTVTLTGAAVAAVALAAVARRRLVLVTVCGDSMRPGYAAGDLLLGTRTRVVRRGQVIVFRPPSGTDAGDPPYRVKRVAALPGDLVPEWVAGHRRGTRVPAGHLVVRGDADRSEDSRHYGFVRRHDVLAVVRCRVRAADGPAGGEVPAAPRATGTNLGR